MPVNGGEVLKAGGLLIDLDHRGFIQSVVDTTRDHEYIPQDHTAPLLSVVIDGKLLNPSYLDIDRDTGRLVLTFPDTHLSAVIQSAIKSTHITFELVAIEGGQAESVVWGPYPTTIREKIGEAVGVVRDAHFAFGIQALNGHTIGGRPAEITESGEGGEEAVAVATETGSAVRAFSRERDGGVLGSKIALFGCPAGEALNTIGELEIAEGLPHPMLDGVWGKQSPIATISYLIADFNEAGFDDVLAYAQQAGFRYLYHGGPFETWGHFELSKRDFPNGDASLKRCVEKASAVGVRLGVHTLSNFLTPNDPYVTPVPDSRLMRLGSSTITESIDTAAATIHIADPTPFREKQWMSTAVLGSELVQYGSISEDEPWRLLECKRGAFGTTASSHAAGTDIGKLIDHPYNVFFPNLEMQRKLTARLVQLFNETGLRQISFDGLEGCDRTGHGIYAHNLFVDDCFRGWKEEVINDASRLLHYNWHIHTRMNWGEPWGKSTREGMPEYRFKNQAYFERNLLPPMMGWFQLRLASSKIEATNLSDIEWVLSKCAGYHAGFALATSLEAMQKNGQTGLILDAIKQWETARLSGKFSTIQRERLRDPQGEFHLEAAGDDRWNLFPVTFSPTYEYAGEERQPGEPTRVEWEIDNSHHAQTIQFTLSVQSDAGTSEEDCVIDPTFSTGIQRVTFTGAVNTSQYLVFDGGNSANVYDINWNLLRTLPCNGKPPVLTPGKQSVQFDCRFSGEAKPLVNVTFKTLGNAELVE